MADIETSHREPGFGSRERRKIHLLGAARGAAENRGRWQDLLTLAVDFAFETDAHGRFSFVFPDVVLGWPASRLLGSPADTLLPDTSPGRSFNPFATEIAYRSEPAWVRHSDGSLIRLSFSAIPLIDRHGTTTGCRGVAVELSDADADDDVASATGAPPRDPRREALAPRMMRAVLHSLMRELEAEGIAVFDLPKNGTSEDSPTVLYGAGGDNAAALGEARALLQAGEGEPLCAQLPDGGMLVAVPCRTRFGERAGLALWRARGARAWDVNDRFLTSSAALIVRAVLEHVVAEREASLEAQTDPLTGLFTRRAFLDELSRRIGRLEFEQLPGTLILIDLDRFKELNATLGHEVGDAALLAVASLLREVFRPTDLIGRLGGDTFVVWLDGADHMTAAERAEQLRRAAPERTAVLGAQHGNPLTMSIGIATRDVDSQEGAREMVRRAGSALDAAKGSGGDHWRVAHRVPLT